ncbi:hypothetical protein KUCAC02_016726 [Chaenocephalus aceratus]|nr:hypothetical protein KUCAC02_016726 [Chaenocephalus aceratus]
MYSPCIVCQALQSKPGSRAGELSALVQEGEHEGPGCKGQEKSPQRSSRLARCMSGSHEQGSRAGHRNEDECRPKVPAGPAVGRRSFSWEEQEKLVWI